MSKDGLKVNGEDNGADVFEGATEKHAKAAAVDEIERRMRERHAAAPQPSGEPAPAQPAAEAPPPPEAQARMIHNGKPVRDHIGLWIYDDGSYHIAGPIDDHMRFAGLLGVLRDLEYRNWDAVCTAMERQAQQAAAQAASPQGKKGAMRRMFGNIGRAIQNQQKGS